MAEQLPTQFALREPAARKLATTTKTHVQLPAITPRWLTLLLPWKPVEAGILRVNRVAKDHAVDVVCSAEGEDDLPTTYVDYDDRPREYTLTSISTILNVNTRVADLFGSPFDQVREQLRLTIEIVKERQEDQLINNEQYGLINNVDPSMVVQPRKGPPTPDDLDELIAKVWKEPAFFLAHPRTIAAFGRECTRRGVPPPTVTMFGSPFITWRGLPLIPCDKVPVEGNKSSILLLRAGEKKQGVIGCFQPGLPGEQSPGLSVRFMGINQAAVASYLVSLYCSAAVLSYDALGVLSGVELGNYHEYK
ncbi:MAG: family 2A encapsulin nanocompartment shell protein [Polyangiales bacterium]